MYFGPPWPNPILCLYCTMWEGTAWHGFRKVIWLCVACVYTVVTGVRVKNVLALKVSMCGNIIIIIKYKVCSRLYITSMDIENVIIAYVSTY